jgi:hypothetical protein
MSGHIAAVEGTCSAILSLYKGHVRAESRSGGGY